jgi:hypothetical protein
MVPPSRRTGKKHLGSVRRIKISAAGAPKFDLNGEHLRRVRRMALALPGTSEKISHGEPTFFVNKKVFAMFADNHHNHGSIAVWLPAPPGSQQQLIQENSKTYFKPPYVGVRGWIGIELENIDDEELSVHIHESSQMIAAKKAR